MSGKEKQDPKKDATGSPKDTGGGNSGPKDPEVAKARETAIYHDLKPLEIPLESLFLDPNNPRFYGADWTYVPDDRITDAVVQAEARRRLENVVGIENLKMNMEVNGYLPIDRIVVRQFEGQVCCTRRQP